MNPGEYHSTRKHSYIWLGLGSNVGNRLSHIHKAIDSLQQHLSHIQQAPVYESAAQDYTEQNDFLNTVVTGQTTLSPIELLKQIMIIEKNGGRKRNTQIPKGPRTIDIDILLWEDSIIETHTEENAPLYIPHPSMAKRLFVLKPLLALNPALRDPRDGIPFSKKASQLNTQIVTLYK